MAYIKIFGIKSTVKKAVDYITNPDKTDEQNLVSSYGCSPETADLTFAMAANPGKDNVMEKGDNLAWHMIISFKPGEITDPNVAHEAATKIADATLKGKQMTSYVADGNRPGFEQWARKNNLKEAAKTFSYLSQHNLLNYEEFQNQKVIQNHCEVYRACHDVVCAEKDAPDKALYHKQHQTEYQLHDVTLKELASAKKEKQDLQKQQKTLQVIKHNFDAMIRETGIKVPEKAPSPKVHVFSRLRCAAYSIRFL